MESSRVECSFHTLNPHQPETPFAYIEKKMNRTPSSQENPTGGIVRVAEATLPKDTNSSSSSSGTPCKNKGNCNPRHDALSCLEFVGTASLDFLQKPYTFGEKYKSSPLTRLLGDACV
jgi:hypothetical protein